MELDEAQGFVDVRQTQNQLTYILEVVIKVSSMVPDQSQQAIPGNLLGMPDLEP